MAVMTERRRIAMPDLLIRGLKPEIVQRLKDQAKRNRRSMQAEAREIIEQGVQLTMAEWLDAMHELTKNDPPWQPGDRTVVDDLYEARAEQEAKIDRLLEDMDRRAEND